MMMNDMSNTNPNLDPTATSPQTVTVVMEFDTRTDANGRATNGREKVMVKNVKRTDDAINETMAREASKRHALPCLIWFY